jgi:hypothetical protein
MPDRERRSHGASSVTGGGLYPDILERAFTEDSAVGNTVQGNASRETQIVGPDLPVHRAGEAQYDFLCNR